MGSLSSKVTFLTVNFPQYTSQELQQIMLSPSILGRVVEGSKLAKKIKRRVYNLMVPGESRGGGEGVNDNDNDNNNDTIARRLQYLTQSFAHRRSFNGHFKQQHTRTQRSNTPSDAAVPGLLNADRVRDKSRGGQ